jgi:glycosyltransferase involved in cell wall biosynthesis
MKIGIDARLWSESGVGRYIRNLVSGIDEQELKNPNHRYTIYLLQKDFDSVKFKSNSFEKKVLNVRWHSIQEQLSVTKNLKKENFDLVHFPYFSIPLSYTDPFVITIHDLIIKRFPTGKASTLPGPLYKVKHAVYNKILEHGIHKSKEILVPSEFVKKDILDSFDISQEKITVTYEGVDPSFQKEKLEVPLVKDLSYFLYVGNAYPHKNLEFLVQGFEHFIEENPQYIQSHLVLVGKKDFFYERLQKSISTKSNIIVLDSISDGELSYLYENAQAVVSASKSEGFGLPLLEALQSKSLVVCSDIPIFKEICGKAAIYFNNTKVESIAHAFHTVLTMSNQDKKRMISLGTAQVKNFSWDTMVEKTVEVYERK